MSFDRLARHYRWMECVLAGSKLQRCRTAFIDNVSAARRALLLGEGNGRFLVELFRARPDIHVTCVDASAAMLARARARLRALALERDNVEFCRRRYPQLDCASQGI